MIFGATFSLNYRDERQIYYLVVQLNRYLGLHYGEVIWTTNYIPNPNRYYDNYGNKDDVNFYTKASYNVTNKLNLFTDLQYRMVFYNATSIKFDDVNDTFRFFNPKAGLNYQLDEKMLLWLFWNCKQRNQDATITKVEQLNQSVCLITNWVGNTTLKCEIVCQCILYEIQ